MHRCVLLFRTVLNAELMPPHVRTNSVFSSVTRGMGSAITLLVGFISILITFSYFSAQLLVICSSNAATQPGHKPFHVLSRRVL